MEVTVRAYEARDISSMCAVWNEVVREGVAFPQTEELDEVRGVHFFGEQSHCGVAEDENGEIVGVYILHPNNVGRCGHICNASYAVKSELRGNGIGKQLVLDCMQKGKQQGFRILQFNAVVKTNTGARALYEKLGFTQLGVIEGGFLMKNGEYQDICPYYCKL